MAAVLARKQADALLKALVAEGRRHSIPPAPLELSVPVSRLLQCLVEEAEATQETIIAALQFLAETARGCHADRPNWIRLCQGIYGEELLHQAWLLYASMDWSDDADVGGTCAFVAAKRQSETYWTGAGGIREILTLLDSETIDGIARGLFTCIGLGFQSLGRLIPRERVEQLVFHPDVVVWCPAVWACALAVDSQDPADGANPPVLDRILYLWLSPCTLHPCNDISDILAFALSRYMRIFPAAWRPGLSPDQIVRVRELATAKNDIFKYGFAAACTVACYSREIWSKQQLLANLKKLPPRQYPHATNLIREIQNE
jgi:hypothetical protein